MEILLRRARVEDRARVLQVEAQATPKLRYLHAVFEHWVQDRAGELIVAELDGSLVGVGKLTVLPDGTAWLEALRVTPEAQGRGIGKQFYRRFASIAQQRSIPVMRMYTGVRNAVSRGLAERYGLQLAATYRGAAKILTAADNQQADNCQRPAAPQRPAIGTSAQQLAEGFHHVTDPNQATELLLPHKQQWGGFLVMNRTFYQLTPALCVAWAEEGKVYHHKASGSVLVLGARFLADQALHIACMVGDHARCLAFAEQSARLHGVPKLQCMFPPGFTALQDALLQRGYQLEPSDFIVMEGAVENAAAAVQETQS